MRFLSRKEMAARRGLSMSSEKRLQKLYPHQYPTMTTLTPGRVAAPEDQDNAFSQWLIDQQKARNAEAGEK